MGKLIVAGIGPGNELDMTRRCHAALARADVIVGYTVYVDLVRAVFPDKVYYSTGMMREVERCREAIELAGRHDCVCIVSSGDAGIYGMASLICELAAERPDVEIEIIPGVTAAVSGAALLGAPIGHDFAVISLSDLLTPWTLIEKRLRQAAAGDFVICLYNPGSRKRADYLQKACAILLDFIPPERVCAVARNIGRDGETYTLTTLADLRETKADMLETVFIGSSSTRRIGRFLVTSRGYDHG